MWGPKFTHNISLFYPTAILNYFGIDGRHPYYSILETKVITTINTEVRVAAVNLNNLIRNEFRKDLYDIEEYTLLPDYATALDLALSNPAHVGVTWEKTLVQAKFIDTNILGGLKELIEIQKLVYPTQGQHNLGAWVSLYNRWKDGTDDRIGETLRKRLSVMMSRGSAPFAELIETGNDMYPAYPTHPGKNTLRDFKPTYRREMRAAYHRVVAEVELMIQTLPPIAMTPDIVEVSGAGKAGFTWKAKSGNTIFVIEDSIKLVGTRFRGTGFILSSSGSIMKRWSGWIPK